MAVSKIKDIILPETLGCITSLLRVDDNTLLLAAGQAIYSVSVPEGELKVYSRGYKYIPDMTNMGTDHFAFIDQGTWFRSDICRVNRKKGTILAFQTDTYCSGIAYRDGHFFVTYSAPDHIFQSKPAGYVKMIDENGQVQKLIQTDANKKHLFSREISKIYVTSEPGMTLYVADIGKHSLQTIKIHSIKKTASCEEAWDFIKVNSILCKNNRLILAVGGQRNQILRLSSKGCKKIVENSQLNGVPKACCFVESLLAVATTKEAGWFSAAENKIEIFLHKEEESTASDDHVILM